MYYSNAPQTEYLHLLSETKVQSGIWIFASLMNDNMLGIVNSHIEEHNKNSFFYMAYSAAASSGELAVDQVDSLIWMQVSLHFIIL